MTQPTLFSSTSSRELAAQRVHYRRASARSGVVIAATLLAIVGICAWWYLRKDSSDALSLEEQKLFHLPDGPSQPASTQDTQATPKTIDLNRWKIPSKAIEFSTAQLQSRCTTQVDQLIREFPESVEANNIAARVYFFLRQPDKAEPYWRKCLEIGPQSSSYYSGLAMILEERGQPEEVQKLIEKAHSLGLKSAETNIRWIKAIESLGQVDLALNEATTAIQSYPDSHELWQIQGQLYNQLGRFEEAEGSFRKSLELGGSSERILPPLVLSLSRQKKQQEAAEIRKQFSKENSQSEKREGDYQVYYDSNLKQLALAVFQTSARVFLQNRRANDYRIALQQCIELNPNDSEAIIALADLAKSSQQIDEAKDLLEQATRINPQDVSCYLSLANLSMLIGDKTLAESTLLRAVELPNGFVAQHALAQMYLLQGRQPEALKLAEQVIERDQSVEAYLLHAFICNSMGKTEAASSSLEKARKIAPSDPRVQSMKLPQP